MKRSKKKPSLLTGLVMIIMGAGGIGYIPGKPVAVTIVFLLVLASGILIAASYAKRPKSGQQGRNKRIPDVSGRRKRYSQYAA